VGENGLVRDPTGLERGYANEFLAEIRRDGRVLVDHTELVGAYPDTMLLIVFRVHNRPCLFGVRDHIWEEDNPSEFDAERAVTSSYLRWLEALDTGELPHRCRPDSDGVTWLDLWDDWT
jgi:hypothetical protein